MVRNRNYGVGTGYTSSGVTGRKNTFAHDEKIYACHVWDELAGDEWFEIHWMRKENGVWKVKLTKTWKNTGFASAYQYSWMQNYPPGEWRVFFYCEPFGPFAEYFTIQEAAAPPAPPEPEYPQTISRGPYSFAARNAEEVKQLREFLGLFPPGDDLDTWLSKRDLAGLQEWKDYWFGIFGPMGRADMLTFIDNKLAEYKAKLEPSLLQQFFTNLAKGILDALTFIKGLTQPNINTFLVDLLKLPDGEARIEAFGLSSWKEFVKEYPEYDVLTDSPKGSISVAAILGIVAAIVSFGTLVNWLRKELPEPTGMAVWAAVEAEDWETANKANKQYREFIGKMRGFFPTVLGWLNPFIAAFMNNMFGSQEAQADTFQELIDAELAIKTGTLIINPTPGDAKVSVEGEIPTTGVFSKELPAGTYSWTVSKFGFTSKSGVVEIKEGITEELNITIEEVIAPPPLETKLIINVVPEDAAVEVAGVPEITSAGTYTLDPGSYTIDFKKDGYDDERRTVFLDEGKTETVSVIMKEIIPEPPPEELKGSLTISVEPTDAIIAIAGQPEIIAAGTYELDSGSYSVKASKEGFISQTKTAYVSEKKDTVVSFILEEVETPPELPTKATIEITSEPTNSDIYIDGAYTWTKTPYTTVLDAGTYIIRVQQDGFFPQEASVTVSEGDEIIVPFVLEEIPEPDIPVVEYLPQEPYWPEYEAPTYYTPPVQTTPYSQVSLPDYNLLSPPSFAIAPKPTVPTTMEKEVLINIETTDAKPWKGKIFSIAWLDLSMPEAEPQIIVDESEMDILKAFIDVFEQTGFTKIWGFKTIFDYRYIFNKLMLYRMQSKAFFDAELGDVKQLMDQVKEAFVYFPDKTGKLDDYGKELLGIGKYGTQEALLRRYIAGDIPYVERFQLQQIQVTKGLYDLFRFSSSGLSSASIPIAPEETFAKEPFSSPQTPQSAQTKKCPNCLADQPIGAKECDICKTKL